MKKAPMESGSPLRCDIRKKASRQRGIEGEESAGLGGGQGRLWRVVQEAKQVRPVLWP